jgi:hypothetical protein
MERRTKERRKRRKRKKREEEINKQTKASFLLFFSIPALFRKATLLQNLTFS